jgi:hypothetical protein
MSSCRKGHRDRQDQPARTARKGRRDRLARKDRLALTVRKVRKVFQGLPVLMFRTM